jgi:ketosteroid isomerase-like protein
VSHADWMREGYARYSRRDLAFVDEYFAPEIRWSVPGPQGMLEGRDAVKAFFDGLTEIFSAHRIELVDSVESADKLWCYVTHVLTTLDGVEHEVSAVHMWTIADGRATAMTEVNDTAAFGIAAGMIPQAGA